MERITFADIAGYEDEKRQAEKIVGWLKNYDVYKKEGAYLPKGVLLDGAPGVGKTMFSKAIATESNSYFVEAKLSATSDIDSTISKFAAAFEEARKHRPAILFLDELDQLISDNDGTFDSDEKRKITDFLLQELDGIDTSDGVLVLATCNKRCTLPRALLRSGRMDHHIEFEMPDFEDRLAICNLYLAKNHRFDKIDRKQLTYSTYGMQGADIKSMCNTVLIKCLDENKEFAEMSDFEETISTILKKDIKRAKQHRKAKDSVIVYHELGHFAVYYHYYNKPCAIDVEGGKNIKGSVRMNFDERESGFSETDYMENIHYIDVLIAGKINEEAYTNKVSIGCGSDIMKASSIFYNLYISGCFGFEGVPVYDGGLFEERNTNEYLLRREERQTNFLEKRAEVVKQILNEEKPLIEYLYPILMDKGTLSLSEVNEYLDKFEKKGGEQK